MYLTFLELEGGGGKNPKLWYFFFRLNAEIEKQIVEN